MKYLIVQFFGAVALIAVVILSASGCYSSRSIRQFSELDKAYVSGDPIRALTVDSILYTFDTFSFTDSTLNGEGNRRLDGVTENFKGSLKFSEIVFMERFRSNGWKALWVVPMAVAIVGGVATLTETSEFSIRRPAGSCPFVYSFDGSEFILEAEAFSTSISQALEAETFHVLSSLGAIEGELNVRITNERPETHLFNSVNLYAVDAKNSSSVVLDTQNSVWAVNNAIPPKVAYDHSNRDIIETIATRDGKYWKSDLKNISSGSDFRDMLEVQFELPQGISEATLIVDAINSDLITEVYRSIGAVVGDESLAFYRSLEQDPALKDYILDWIRKSSLLVEIAGRNGWNEVGTLLPEANVTSFSRAIRLKNLDDIRSPVTLRFSSMADVWHVDALSVDYSRQKPLAMHALEMTSAKASIDDTGLERAVSNSDSLYAMILPPDYMDLVFDSTPADKMQAPVYVFAARGYLYEWFQATEKRHSSGISNGFGDIDRSEMLKLFIKQENMFLHAIYTRWSNEDR